MRTTAIFKFSVHISYQFGIKSLLVLFCKSRIIMIKTLNYVQHSPLPILSRTLKNTWKKYNQTWRNLLSKKEKAFLFVEDHKGNANNFKTGKAKQLGNNKLKLSCRTCIMKRIIWTSYFFQYIFRLVIQWTTPFFIFCKQPKAALEHRTFDFFISLSLVFFESCQHVFSFITVHPKYVFTVIKCTMWLDQIKTNSTYYSYNQKMRE